MIVLIFIAIICINKEANAFDHTTRGEPTCKDWIKDKNTPTEKENVSWIAGYVSGLAAVLSIENEIDLLKNESINNLFGWTDEYCKRHPNERISGPAEDYLFDILKQKKHVNSIN